MKKLLFLFIALTTLANISYASFPITKNSSSDISNSISFQIAEEEEEDGGKWWLLIPLVIALGFGSYFLIKTWWRAWRDRVKWVRILTKIILILGGLIVLLSIISSLSGGLVYNMQ
jgi:hypothetical protein